MSMLGSQLATLTEQVELIRLDAARKLNPERQAELGQFMTPAPLARLMGSMLSVEQERVSLLDAGAGVGSLLAAGVEALCAAPRPPELIEVTAYEIDPALVSYLEETLDLCGRLCQQRGVELRAIVLREDFIAHAVESLLNPLFGPAQPQFSCAILNPPYRKIRTSSVHRRLLSKAGIETSNLYTGFLALALRLLAPGGELVAITPRSFCNGPYFRPFRALLLENLALRRIHLFESREQAFQDDDVLQENVILAGVKGDAKPEAVTISVGADAEDEMPMLREASYSEVVHPQDRELFIRLVADGAGQHVAARMGALRASLVQLGLAVSTGRVVDFRAASYLRPEPASDTVPLIYPTHFDGGKIVWPKAGSKKPNAIVQCPETEQLLIPSDFYVLVKRFSAKEERRRVTAAVYDPEQISNPTVGFENHLNYFHANGQGIAPALAYGLAAFLNSTILDSYVRQFSGHTQVNATDLRNLRYPSLEQLLALGRRVRQQDLAQEVLDQIVTEELGMADQPNDDPLRTTRRVGEALAILRELGFPRQQLNERSALTLLALLDLTPDRDWSEASAPLCGITPMMEFFAHHYGKSYKPNTRETVRRQTVHQFLDAGLITANPDDPSRPVNSPKAVYQIEPLALNLLRSYGTDSWSRQLYAYRAEVKSLQERYAQERAMERIPIRLPTGKLILLSPGGQNTLIKLVIDEFAARFTPGGQVIYVGDTDEKFAYFDRERAQELGITIEAHGKMPDVILYYPEKDWLVLVEAVTSHGPIDPKRRADLAQLFRGAQPGLIYVTAFLTRQAMREYLPIISWETEVWVAESPTHLIHFDGERFLGPYEGA